MFIATVQRSTLLRRSGMWFQHTALRWSAAIYSASNLGRRDITCWLPLNHCVKPTLILLSNSRY